MQFSLFQLQDLPDDFLVLLLIAFLEAHLGIPDDATGVSDIGRSPEGVLLGEV
jgi:hypothetical protein